MNVHIKKIVPLSLRDAPSLIERLLPSMKLSAEAQKERKAVQGQTLTALGSYWKGRKPLILVKACVLGCLLPATDNSEEDLFVFESLMGIDDAAFQHRAKKSADFPEILSRSYTDRMDVVLRPEEISIAAYDSIWPRVNKHLNTDANSFKSLIDQLGIMRFGHRPVVSDTFTGGGSIPFEAARLGCDVIASDLNPIACLLTWGTRNIIGASGNQQKEIELIQRKIANAVEEEIVELGVETDALGNRAKAYLYCLETRCPQTDWRVPMLSTRVVSKSRRSIVRLVPDHRTRSYDFEIVNDVSDIEFADAEKGTVSDGRLTHPQNPNELGVAISTIRHDRKEPGGKSSNGLRKWERHDAYPRENDIFQERLYCIQWVTAGTLNKGRQDSYFAAPTPEDLQREEKVKQIVSSSLAEWQKDGLVPSSKIEPGDKTDEPIRTRGWTHWHHLFSPRQLLFCALAAKHTARDPIGYVGFLRMLDWSTKLCRYGTGAARESISQTFYNQAFNTFYNYGVRPFYFAKNYLVESYNYSPIEGVKFEVINSACEKTTHSADIFITDPPYADAVNYHEIAEFFIAWIKANPPLGMEDWIWDSRRRLAIKGKGEEFRANMVNAYRVMAEHMPDNGIQVVMFTHQDGKVWSDMAQIFWGAGLQVMADWYIATETTSELKKGGYVQGTHIIVLRKRNGSESGYSDEIAQEVKEEVAHQIEDMVGLNQTLKGHGRSENLFNDADMQMAGYAAALRVLTRYVKIDGKDMTIEAVRPRKSTERTVIDDIIEYAVQVANEHLVPEGMPESTWRKLSLTERFYLKMMDIESTGAKKIDNYQNFAKAFRVGDYAALMSSVKANDAGLKTASEFGKRQMGDDDFGRSLTRAVLYALWEMGNGVEDDLVMGHLRDLVDNYFDARGDLIAIAKFIADKRNASERDEAQNAQILAGKIRNEKLS